ncbi:DUF431-domain-containing protein [Gonapodya prolifera JEL478]|uniref:DUF431-domain-containing protein n=1 Tax=Gonapodya prolifera (strain JEL478) TaxID=1344416 RepID=A0A139AGH4_GONPJ|nr:DUF431-domain-containing protein [Gonapodya prolifera JEL478]|eukprot:KXS15513.1 DUF431-domain-containing protein [Gonapodya prolifera JEL478]
MPKYIVEHMEDELYEWLRLEYAHLASTIPESDVLITNLPSSAVEPLSKVDQSVRLPPATDKSVASLVSEREKEPFNTSSDTGTSFVIPPPSRVCFLDEVGTTELRPDDAERFDWFVFGGILGDVSTGEYEAERKDRGKSVREAQRFEVRHLGPHQFPVDHAVLCARLILEKGRSLDQISFAPGPPTIFPVGSG